MTDPHRTPAGGSPKLGTAPQSSRWQTRTRSPHCVAKKDSTLSRSGDPAQDRRTDVTRSENVRAVSPTKN